VPLKKGEASSHRQFGGLMPLIAVESLEAELMDRMPVFARRMKWFYDNKVYLKENGRLACTRTPGVGKRRLLSLVNEDRLRSILSHMLSEMVKA
jgi:hypothetical protein